MRYSTNYYDLSLQYHSPSVSPFPLAVHVFLLGAQRQRLVSCLGNKGQGRSVLYYDCYGAFPPRTPL